MAETPEAPSRPIPPPPRRPASRPPGRPPPAKAAPPAQVSFGELPPNVGHRIGVYGPGGIGKTTLACTAPPPVAVFDLDDSLGVLAPTLEGLDVRRVVPQGGQAEMDWSQLRGSLAAPGWDDIATIVIDSATKAEELATAWTLANVPHDKGGTVSRLEDYGYGKGYQYIYETFLLLLGDLDRHVRAGRHVVLVCHDCTATVPNPAGEDYIRYEPRLQTMASGKSSVRLRVREWLDHLLFLGYDIDVQKGKNSKVGKGKGSATRTIYPVELPHCMAKSRSLASAMPMVMWDPGVWNALLRLEDVPAETTDAPETPPPAAKRPRKRKAKPASA